jgi:hypothetical protein
LGVLQAGAVLAVTVEGAGRFPAAERDAYHRALVALAGTDAGRDLRAWRTHLARTRVPRGADARPAAAPVRRAGGA